MQRVLKFSFGMGLALISLLSMVQTISHQEKYKDACNVEMVRAYGMVGRNNPNAARMEMCPGIRQSCCLKKDQLMMYNQWVHLKEVDFIKHRYDHNAAEYVKFLNLLHKADKVIEDIEKKLSHKKISNCKELAKRIANYEIPQLVPKIKKNLRKMREFMVTSFEGFYCSICDHKNHPHLDTSKKTITYCDGFCRTMVENTLSSLLFFHVDIVKYANMVSKFMVSCDFKGDYETEAMIPKKLIFFQHEEDVHKLNDCRDNRNKKEWMAYCAPVCQHFSMVNIDLFFEPNIEKIEVYSPWLEQEIHEKKIEHMKHPMFADSKNKKKKPSKRRILSTEKKEEKKDDDKDRKLTDKKKPKQRGGENNERPEILDIQVFKSKMTSKVDFTGYTINFSEDGVCQFEAGANSVITVDQYNEVKTLMHLTRMTKKSHGVFGTISNLFGGPTKAETKEATKASGAFGPRGLAGEMRLGMSMFMLVILNLIFQ